MKTLFRLLLAAAVAVALVQPQPLAAQAKKNGAAKSGQTNAKSGPASAKSGTAKSDSNGGQSNGGQLGTFGDWEAYADARDGFCYAGTKPTKQEGKYTQRGDVFILVTHRPKEKTFDVVSIEAGYVYKDGSEVKAAVGDQALSLFGQGGQAWARDAAGDAQLVKAMRAGSTLVVKGTSSKGTLTVDTYSLKGVSAALDAINKACPRK
ncbi:MAG: invasion associated locus B family protein [Pseudomonadota bacterium]